MSGGFLGPLKDALEGEVSDPSAGRHHDPNDQTEAVAPPQLPRQPPLLLSPSDRPQPSPPEPPQPPASSPGPATAVSQEATSGAVAYAARLLASTMFEEGPRIVQPAPGSTSSAAPPAEAVGHVLETVDGILVTLATPTLQVGRGQMESASPRLPVRIETVSRLHLEIETADRGHQCRDLGSSNGTVLRRRDRLIEVGPEAVALQPDDVICTLNGEQPIAVYRLASSGRGQ